jgi:hypothetical protein
MFPEVGQWLRLNHQNHGLLGFQQGAQIVASDMVVGRMDYGG